jgi:hypothetical protein
LARGMNKQRSFAYLLIVLIGTSFTALAAEPASVIWWDVKSDNTGSMASLGEPKNFILRWGKFPPAGKDGSPHDQSVSLNSARTWIRTPDGIISEANLSPEKETIVLDFPGELNPAESNGLYLVGIHVDAGVKDIDSDGTDETVHYYAKYLIYHQKDGCIQGDGLDVFFNDPDKIALEIGPLNAPGMKEIPSMKADCQEALKRHKMKVFYKGQPLADAKVAVLTESGWEKREKTDSNGIISITPVENEEKENRSLYVVTHKDLLTAQYYSSSLMMYVLKPPPEWMSKAKGFISWAVMGTGLFIVYVGWRIYIKKRRDRKTMLEFERHKIIRD